MSVKLGRIRIFPIKSLDGVELSTVDVLSSGALAGDRRFALVDEEGRYVNGKRTATVHRVRAKFDLRAMRVQLRIDDAHIGSDLLSPDEEEFSLVSDQPSIAKWLGKAVGIPCRLVENRETGFPDDQASCGPTVLSSGTLREVASWFPGLSVDEARLRFRANLEIDAPEPFWEDRLVTEDSAPVQFAVGDVRWLGVNVCGRCVVPSRASTTGVPIEGFQRTFANRRENSLPTWADPSGFNHFYRLAINTRLAPGQAATRIAVGDPVALRS